MDHDHSGNETSPGPRAFIWVLCGFIVIAAFFLFSEHRAHALGYLPFLLLLACPLMHLFMHGGHGGHDGHAHESGKRTDDPHQHQLNPPNNAAKKERTS